MLVELEIVVAFAFLLEVVVFVVSFLLGVVEERVGVVL